mgnify:CR=1 FL=1
MNKIAKIFAVIALVAIVGTAQAQKASKIGHINIDEIVALSPGVDNVQKEMEKFVKDLETQLGTMENEYKTKLTDYQKNASTMSAIIKETKEKELNDLMQRMQAFQQGAQKQIQEQNAKLLQPIYDKAAKAVGEVAKENGYTHIVSSGALLYSEDGSDITPLVKKKLGITK